MLALSIILGIIAIAAIIIIVLLIYKKQFHIIENSVIINKDVVVKEEKEHNEPMSEEQELELFWNNKWKKSNITYAGRTIRPYTNISGWGVQTSCDVKAFILDNDEILKQLIVRHELVGKSYDETMMNIQKLICFGQHIGGWPEFKPLQYKSDTSFNKSYEFWQFPFETLQPIQVKWNKHTEEYHLAYEDEIWKELLKDEPVVSERFGDCEDGAILIAALAINAGIPAYRVKVGAGNVSNREYLEAAGFSLDYLSEGGHAYCLYLASDNEWRIIDWCYYPDADTEILNKPLAKNGGFGGCYKDTWFTFNNQYAWDQKALDITVPKLSKVQVKEELTN